MRYLPRIIAGLLVLTEVVLLIIMIFTSHYDPAIHDYVCPDWVGWSVLGGMFVACLAGPTLWGMGVPHRVNKKVLAELTGRLNVPKDYFMPFSVCPSCDTEGLHWMRPKKTEADLDPADIDAKTGRVRASAEFSRTRPRDYHYGSDTEAQQRYLRELEEWKRLSQERAIQYLLAREQKFDVFRTCVNCGHSWGQHVGLMVECPGR